MGFLPIRVAVAAFVIYLGTACDAATNEKITTTFKTDGSEPTIFLRYQDDANHYAVKIRNNNRLEFARISQGDEHILGKQEIPAGLQYREGQQWAITGTAHGHLLSASVRNQDGVEVTSGTVFDRKFEDGSSKVKPDDGVTWGGTKVLPLPQHVTAPADLENQYDVVIAGAGTAGSMAAVQAARLGATVLVVEETDWIGGQMAAAAVASMDEGAEYPAHGIYRDSVRERGLYREFFNLATHMYGTMGLSTDTCYITENHFGLEPATAQELLYEMFQQQRAAGSVIDVVLETSITQVLKSENKVTGVDLLLHTTNGPVEKSITSRILIDATEYGDVLPLAEVPYRVGTWTSDNINLQAEEFPSVQDFTWTAVIKQYPDGPPAHLMMTQPPPGYDKNDLRTALDNPRPTTSTSPWSWQRFIAYRGMPNSATPGSEIANPWAKVTKTHMNVGANDAHIDVLDVENMDSRLHMEYDLKLSTLRLLYYVQNDMTEPVRDWTIALDEGFDTPYNRRQNDRLIEQYPDLAPYRELLYQFPPMAYARESRRMVGVYTVRAAEVDRRTGPMIFPTSIAVGDYAVDLHGADSPSELEADLDKPGDLGAIGFAGNQLGPFTIPLESLIPEKMDGFLAAEKNFSQSRLVSGATRLQPSTMLIGQAAGALAGLAVSKNVDPRDLHPPEVQKALLDAGDTLFAARFNAHKLPGVALDSEEWKSLQLCLLYGIVHLADAQQHLGGLEILSGATGDDGWSVTPENALQYSGDGTGTALLKGTANEATTAGDDYTVSAQISRSGGAGTVGLVGRFSSNTNFYHARLFGQNLQLFKWDNNKAIQLASGSVKYVNGTSATLSMTFDGSAIKATLHDDNGTLLKEITASDTSHSQGSAGLRVQPGAAHSAEIAAVTVRAADGAAPFQWQPEFRQPTNFATDLLTHGQFAIHLARYLDMPTSGPVAKTAAALRQKGITFGSSAAGENFDRSSIVTRADAAIALASAFKAKAAETSASLTFKDVPQTHPANAAIQTLASQGIAAESLLRSGDSFSPDQQLTMADSLHLFADLIVSPPADAANTVTSHRKPRPIK